MPDDISLQALGRDVKNFLEYFRSLGVDSLPWVGPPPSASQPPHRRVSQPPRAPSRKESWAPPDHESSKASEFEDSLTRIRSDLGDCRRCRLSEGRNRLVFGEGPDDAVLMFVGLGPGEMEDREGRPFLGPPGKLLSDIIAKGLRIKREHCYLADLVKCRLPHQRKPFPDEAQTCLPFLLRQIRALRPLVIMALGQEPARYLLGTSEPLSKLRGRFHDLDGVPVMPTDHPSDLLKKPELKRGTWEDVKKVIALLNRVAPGLVSRS